MTARYVRAADVLWRRTASAVIVRRVDGRGTTLQGTAPALWDSLDRPATVDELVSRLRARFSDPAGTMAEDFAGALRELLEDRVVVQVDDA